MFVNGLFVYDPGKDQGHNRDYLCDHCDKRVPYLVEFKCERDQYRVSNEDQKPCLCEECLNTALSAIVMAKTKNGEVAT